MVKQDERWNLRYDEVKSFIETNHRNPSHHFYEERNMHSWVKHNRKQMNAGTLKPERVEKLRELLELMERYRRKNQYE